MKKRDPCAIKRIIGKAINPLKKKPLENVGIYWQDTTSGVYVIDNRYGQWKEILCRSDAYERQYAKSKEIMKKLVDEYKPTEIKNYQINLFEQGRLI